MNFNENILHHLNAIPVEFINVFISTETFS